MNKHQLDFDHKRVPKSTITAQGVETPPYFGGGRPVPIINLDLTQNILFANYLKAHGDASEGDVNYYWPKFSKNSKYVTLLIDVKSNTRAQAKIQFHKLKNAITLEALFAAEAMIVQEGRVGLPVTANSNPKVIMSIPDLGTFPRWRKVAVRLIAKDLIRNGHANRKTAFDETLRLLDSRRHLFLARNTHEFREAYLNDPDSLLRLKSLAFYPTRNSATGD